MWEKCTSGSSEFPRTIVHRGFFPGSRKIPRSIESEENVRNTLKRTSGSLAANWSVPESMRESERSVCAWRRRTPSWPARGGQRKIEPCASSSRHRRLPPHRRAGICATAPSHPFDAPGPLITTPFARSSTSSRRNRDTGDSSRRASRRTTSSTACARATWRKASRCWPCVDRRRGTAARYGLVLPHRPVAEVAFAVDDNFRAGHRDWPAGTPGRIAAARRVRALSGDDAARKRANAGGVPRLWLHDPIEVGRWLRSTSSCRCAVIGQRRRAEDREQIARRGLIRPLLSRGAWPWSGCRAIRTASGVASSMRSSLCRYTGLVYPVNRLLMKSAASRAYRSVRDLPAGVDLAVVAVPPPRCSASSTIAPRRA